MHNPQIDRLADVGQLSIVISEIGILLVFVLWLVTMGSWHWYMYINIIYIFIYVHCAYTYTYVYWCVYTCNSKQCLIERMMKKILLTKMCKELKNKDNYVIQLNLNSTWAAIFSILAWKYYSYFLRLLVFKNWQDLSWTSCMFGFFPQIEFFILYFLLFNFSIFSLWIKDQE